jgi:hypothetical protein
LALVWFAAPLFALSQLYDRTAQGWFAGLLPFEEG